ncbi:SulP family inorganic anion transporter [Micromonospora sp. NPDC018662]|uniref:SulP family inorganic anion transporter n=1 Tax=Micromonospora sp. NPDC018662 TaxID=3364238 RepID=UPI0037BCD254
MSSPTLPWRAVGADLSASVVVFLVALPLCVGIAVASGVPAELGLVTGIVGGLVVGCLPGSTMQVSGPAAGLTVLVADTVSRHGLGGLGTVVLVAGLIQVVLGFLRLGRWFRAISVAVVHGMLAGIGLLLIVGQLYVLSGREAPHTGFGKFAGLPGLWSDVLGSTTVRMSLAVGVATLLVMLSWDRLPDRLRKVPAALVAVIAAAAAAGVLHLPVATIKVAGLLSVVQPSIGHWTMLTELSVLASVATFTMIASAESLFSAAAVDRLHHGPRTDFDKELVAQGTGNAICGMLGALPMTAVIVRSSANVRAGARTRAARVLHGVWLLLFAAAAPGLIELIPLPALAAVLIHAGTKLLPLRSMPELWRGHRGEVLVLAVTALTILLTDLFVGVLVGLGLAIVKTAWETSHVRVGVDDGGTGPIDVTLTGNATFLRLPTILTALNALPASRPVHLDLGGLRHVDLACRTALNTWIETHNRSAGVLVRVAGADGTPDGPPDGRD